MMKTPNIEPMPIDSTQVPLAPTFLREVPAIPSAALPRSIPILDTDFDDIDAQYGVESDWYEP
jgi:hypothetical protein